MNTDPAVIEGIERAVEASPDNLELRLHLAELLAGAGRHGEALAHCRAVLEERPDHVPALRRAATAARAAGERERADSYRRLAEALAPTEEPGERRGEAPKTRPVETTASSGTGEDGEAPPTPPGVVPMRAPETTAERDDEGKDDREGSGAKVLRLRALDGGGDPVVEIEPPDVTLDDVAGMEEVKHRLNVAFLAPMRNPEMRRMYRKSLRGGLMLFGPPGCGKTFIARATAGEMGAHFIAVGLSDVLDMWIGSSERNLHEMFETARRSAPCVLFFDEIDALGQKRSHMRHNPAARGVVNQLLAEMDSVNADNEGVFILTATNHPWDVDAALRRPGRLDRMLLVLPPDEPARRAIVEMNLEDRPVENVDPDWVARKTEGYSGADLAHLVETAAEMAMEDSMTSGQARPIVQRDLKKALKEIKPSTRAWFETARNYAQFANEGGAYDELLAYMRSKRMV